MWRNVEAEAEAVAEVEVEAEAEAEAEAEEAAVAFGRKNRRMAEPKQREVRAVPVAEVAPRQAKPPAQDMDLLMLQEPELEAGGYPPSAAPRRSSKKSPGAMASLPRGGRRGACDMD